MPEWKRSLCAAVIHLVTVAVMLFSIEAVAAAAVVVMVFSLEALAELETELEALAAAAFATPTDPRAVLVGVAAAAKFAGGS